jgi:hypothetical protein
MEENPNTHMKTKELIKRALKHPELFTPGELDYFKLIKRQRKIQKDKQNSSNFLK